MNYKEVTRDFCTILHLIFHWLLHNNNNKKARMYKYEHISKTEDPFWTA